MEETNKKFLRIILRYLILLLIAIPGLDLFYYLFLPLTKLPVYYFLTLFYNPVLLGDVIFVGKSSIEIVGACVAGSAYYFLLILNLSTANIEFPKRLKMIVLSFLAFLVINLIRISVLSIMYLENSPLFEISHEVFWYVGSTLIVVAIWFCQIKYFKLKSIPFYSDLKHLYQSSSLKRK